MYLTIVVLLLYVYLTIVVLLLYEYLTIVVLLLYVYLTIVVLLLYEYLTIVVSGEEAGVCVPDQVCRGAAGSGAAVYQYLPESTQGKPLTCSTKYQHVMDLLSRIEYYNSILHTFFAKQYQLV